MPNKLDQPIIEEAKNMAQDDEESSEEKKLYAQAVGAKLRAVRKQMHLSLQAVEALSKQEFKASVLGAYERGERFISVPRLQRLSILYDIPVDQLLPKIHSLNSRWDGSEHPVKKDRDANTEEDKLTIDLSKLNQVSGQEKELLRRFLNMIQVQRQDFNGRMITIRTDDVRIIAGMFGLPAEAMVKRFDELGLRVRT
ncbi:MAG: transcriptional regulator [Actinobacteria bacterium]|nr:transcriptional regulator [Actinomycetota bacterium]MCL6105021.1 transcriptional regulator [Actinomycetota bacterium]